MQHDEENDDLTPADRELEAALKSLAPSRTTGIDPVAAAFAAGSRATRRQLHFWQATAAAVLLIAIGSWVIPLGRDGHRPSSVIATAPLSMPPDIAVATAQSPPPSHSLIMLEEAVRANGVDGLPATELPTVQNLRVSDLF